MKEGQFVHFRSIADLSDDVYRNLLPKLPRDIEVVCGIPRSGMIVAAMLSTALGARLGTIGGGSFIGARGENIVLPKGRKTLLVDDSIRTGRAMQSALQQSDFSTGVIQTCAVYAQSKSSYLVDHYASILDGERVFQWNFTGTKASREFCWELDGVICTNPSVVDENVDSYRLEISAGVRPLYIPQVPIKAIITSRLERWRVETEEWLERHGVKYASLIMQPDRIGDDVRRMSRPEEYKVAHLTSLGGKLFVEGDDTQARRIAQLSGVPVISIERMCLYGA